MWRKSCKKREKHLCPSLWRSSICLSWCSDLSFIIFWKINHSQKDTKVPPMETLDKEKTSAWLPSPYVEQPLSVTHFGILCFWKRNIEKKNSEAIMIEFGWSVLEGNGQGKCHDLSLLHEKKKKSSLCLEDALATN